jgi:hypothetical protein
MAVEVSEMLSPFRLPVSTMVVVRLKHEPSTCTVPVTEEPDDWILPAIVIGEVH